MITIATTSTAIVPRKVLVIRQIEKPALSERPSNTEQGSAPPPRETSGLGPKARENLVRSNAEPGPDGLTEDQRAQVAKLQARDAEVRRHEEAHAIVGGQYAGQPSYTYQEGPDGKRYAVGGEVSIDVAPVPDDPKATIAKMDVVIAAALAPAEPSGQDRKVASQAARQRIEAIAELSAQRLQDQPAPGIATLAQAIETAGQTPSVDARA